MLDYQPFLQAVEKHLGVEDAALVRAGIEAVLGALDQILDADARGRLAAELPGSLRASVSTASATRTFSTAEFVDVVNSFGNTDRGRYWAQAVLSSIAELDPVAADVIRPALPDPTLMDSLGQGPAPQGSAVPTNRSPEILTEDEIARAVASMPGWTGNAQRLQRSIEIPAERVAPLTDAVHRIQDELSHHARIENAAGAGGADRDDTASLTFTVWTHSLGRVTELDVELARRINEAISTVA